MSRWLEEGKIRGEEKILTASEPDSGELGLPLAGGGDDSRLLLLGAFLLDELVLALNVSDKRMDKVGVERGDEVPKVLTVDQLEVVGPIGRDVTVEAGDVARHGKDSGDGQLRVLGHDDAAHLLVLEDGHLAVDHSLKVA